MYLSDFVFFDDTSTDMVSNEFSVNPNAEALTLQVTGESIPTLTVQGVVDSTSDQWVPLATLNQSNYAFGKTITAAGIFAVSVSGVKKVRISSSGAVGGFKAYGLFV